ncbi:phiSA1p31-related protein [Streptomyces scabiei]|uniref:phiSA1p31-related protein n=1 Tax=Streptomyces scabiei TaxID=1930 RepID=UPI0029A512D3|nr:phiSA1p31-related protein [Streptomyces scabiei]MDX2575928.1 phiSA1p31-related protein [Streptomyces scabiei]MDX2794035.1 phiSA1p31-related protein [Streptomyces scabiei]MDX2885599.1 phiSA1p31-related protein [Streptomyces scabiei]MDX2993448.1 phiSA1p31-related protein [Streptomyces scabiei]MDX3028438.1 phiSA1p31-related protein [Streptomyces scabiei]
MSETFEVGQKVKHVTRGVGEVKFGPYRAAFDPVAYLVEFDDRRAWMVSPDRISAIPEPPKFAVGDVVTLTTRPGLLATVEYGPFDDRDVYVVRLVDEPTDPGDVRTFTALASAMTAKVDLGPIKVGDRVRVTDDDGGGANRFVGMVGTVKELHGSGALLPYLVEFGDGRGRHGDLNGRWNCLTVERVEDESAHTHNGVTYDLTSKYRDRDGDVWHFARFGDTVVGGIRRTPTSVDDGDPFSFAAGYGPLTRVTT